MPLKREDFIRHPLTPLLIILSLGLLIYSNSFHGGFCSDDYLNIVDNPHIRDITDLKGIQASFHSRVLTGLTFALNYTLHKLDVFGYHVFNFISHIMASYLVFWFALTTLKTPQMQSTELNRHKYFIAYFAALIFLMHPIQTQGVSYIFQRSVSMAASFYLGSLLLYAKARMEGRPLYLAGAALTMLLGLFTKENVLTLPLAVLVYEFTFFGPGEKQGLRRLAWIFPFVLVAEILFLVFAHEQAASVSQRYQQTFSQSFSWNFFFTEINVLRTYLRFFILPIGQKHHYLYPVAQGFWQWSTVGSALLLLGLFGWAIQQLRQRRLLSFCIFWFFINTMVEVVLVSFSGVGIIYDHWLYLPMVGFAMFVPAGICYFVKNKRLAGNVLVAVLVIFGVATFQRNKVWQSDVFIWEEIVEQKPPAAWPYAQLGLAHRREGQYEKAIHYYFKAIEVQPDITRFELAQIYVNLSAAYGHLNLFEKEIEYAKKALVLNPVHAQAYGNLSIAYAMTGDFKRAVSFGQGALALQPSADGFNNLGLIYSKMGDLTRARQFFQEALRLDPDHQLARKNYLLTINANKKADR